MIDAGQTAFPADKSDPKVRFNLVYAGLPLGERDNVIIVIADEPINWKRANTEISQDTELGKKILEKLVGLNII